MQFRHILCVASLFLYASIVSAGARPQKIEGIKKLTVGPFDNFQSAIDEEETVLYYTRSQNLTSQVMRVDLKTMSAVESTGIDSDSKNPAVSPNGKHVAITYFKQDAKGDICLLVKGDVACITGSGKGESAPFWVGNDRVGYLQSNDAGDQSKIIIHNIETGKSEIIAEGDVHSPAISHSGKSLVYKVRGEDFVIFDLASKKPVGHLKVQLPGASSAAKFSYDDQYIYFSQFIQDSNQDVVLDSRDESAIFRIKVAGDGGKPEQLTSLAQNCTYPVPGKYSLYMTCAFEGSLDVYRTMLSGVVPTAWDKNDLWDAHKSARSYSDRILFLNQLFSRFDALDVHDFDNRNMMNFMFNKGWLPAAYYAERLKGQGPVYASHLNILETNYKFDSMPVGSENISELTRMLSAQEKKLASAPDSPLKPIAQAYIDFFGSKSAAALQRIETLVLLDAATIYWQTNLLQKIYTGKDSKKYAQILERQMLNPVLSDETRVYYLSRWFDRLPQNEDPTGEIKLVVDRLNKSDKISVQIGELLENEAQLYRVGQAKTEELVNVEIQGISSRVERLKNEYHATRLLFSRSMITLARDNKIRELSSVMSLWLSYLKSDTKEFPYGVEALRNVSLDVAYRFYNGPEKTRVFAAGSFLSGIRVTDDLESHYQYVLFSNTEALWAELTTAYKAMLKKNLIAAESNAFMGTIKKILMSGKTPADADLAEAVTATELIDDQHVGIGVKYLFLGYLYHSQFLRSQKGFEFDRELSEKAHRSYLFAIDGAWNNERIQAAAYQNLGLLHMALRNESLAADFLRKRHTLGFMTDTARIETYWIEASALFRSYRASEALAVIEQAIALKPENLDAFTERQALYAWNAGDYKKAAGIYEVLLPKMGAKAGASFYLSQGFALKNSGDSANAEKAWLHAIELANKESPHPQGRLQYQPKKIKFIAFGLLARLDVSAAKKIEYLTERMKVFDDISSAAIEYYFEKAVLDAQRIKEEFNLLTLLLDSKNAAESAKVASELLRLAEEFAGVNGYMNQTVFSTLKNAMILLRTGRLAASGKLTTQLKELFKNASKEYAADKTPPPSLQRQWLEVKLVEISYGAGQGEAGKKVFEANATSLFAVESSKKFAKEQPDAFVALTDYRDGILKNW
jgi:hypothetical protein